jgi:hypothetical protein
MKDTAVKDASKSFGKVAKGAGLIALGVTAAVAAVKWGIAQYNKYSDAAKEAAKQSQEAAMAY